MKPNAIHRDHRVKFRKLLVVSLNRKIQLFSNHWVHQGSLLYKPFLLSLCSFLFSIIHYRISYAVNYLKDLISIAQ